MNARQPVDVFQGRLFHAEGEDTVLTMTDLPKVRLHDQALAWIDVTGSPENVPDEVLAFMGLDSPKPWETGTNPAIGKQGDTFWIRVVAVSGDGSRDDVRGALLTLIASRNAVVSLHEAPLVFMDELREREEGGSRVGALSAERFVASLLDRQLATYFDAIAEYELAVECLEVKILEERTEGSLEELRRLRRWASRLRRMLAPHQAVFFALARPDFQPHGESDSGRDFELLGGRFDRAMDMVENARELVLGSFALFSTQTAQQTNDRMRILTFVTVITGVLATLVGALGMNFDASFFGTRDVGFWGAVAGLLAITVASVGLARWRKWF